METNDTTQTPAPAETPATTKDVMDGLLAAHHALLKQARRLAATTPRPRRGTPRPCACGCGGRTRGGTWMPGHDAKALSRAIAAARAAQAE